MRKLDDELQNLFTKRKLNDDEYINKKDNLIYCSKCHTPRQNSTGYILCKCQEEEINREIAKQEHENFLAKVAQLKKNGLPDESLYDYTFKNDNGMNPEIKFAHKYVENWDEMKSTSTGLLIWGNVGTGKSFFAGCIANALLEQGVSVYMTNFARILNALTGMYSTNRNEYIEKLNQYSLLIIDDLGIERNSEFAMEQIFNLIDSQYRSKKPMIITTNLTLEEIKKPNDLARLRIYDRILERCIPIKINNQNIRELNAKENFQRVSALFS